MDELRTKLKPLYKKLEPFVREKSIVRPRRGRMFDIMVRAAFTKAFEFNLLVVRSRSDTARANAFFWAGTLRGICEDLTILSYLQTQPNVERDKLLVRWMLHETLTNLQTQTQFFNAHRPFQNILRATTADETRRDQTRIEMQRIWQQLGWTVSGNKIAPSTWALAKGAGIVELYEFFYRFSCDMVHFNPSVLLRSGWGDLGKEVRFGTAHFAPYYIAFSQVYGAYLLCLFFQFLRRNLRPSREIRSVERDIIRALKLSNRWPEMVTFEEMNVSLPKEELSILRIVSQVALAQKPRLLRRRRAR